MRLVILCEGRTEERVLKDFLKPYSEKFSNVLVRSHSCKDKLKAEFKKRAELELADANTHVFCLIDLHEAPFDYPSYIQNDPDPHPKQYAHVKEQMEKAISPKLRSRFHAFPVVHEIETWILADVDAMSTFLNARISPIHSPESILVPASKLKELVKRHRKQDYDKARHGELFFRHMDAQRVYNDNCPHFKEIIKTLLNIQGSSIPK